MPLTRSDIPKLITPGIKATFFKALEEDQNREWEKIAMVVPSESAEETYAWLGQTPQMREFVDERQPMGMSEHYFTLRNKTWETSVAIERAAIEDDQYGQIKIRIQQLAAEVNRHKNELVFGLLSGAFTGTCYDQMPFCDTLHPTYNASGEVVSATYNVNEVDVALSAENLKTAISAMKVYTGNRGKIWNIIPDTLVVPPAYEWTAREILNSAYYPDMPAADYPAVPKTNVLQGALQLIVSPYITDSTSWFLLQCNGPTKPIILQDRAPLEFTQLEADSDSGFMRDQFVYGVRSRYNAGYGVYQQAYGSTS